MKPLVLIILDGWGIRTDKKDNGIEQALKPRFDFYWKNSPHTGLNASGLAVGLPEGVIGNSEVGHMNIGAGRIAYTGLAQIYQAIEDESFYKNPALLQAVNACKKNGSSLHLMGLLSDGAVHSHQHHLYALLDLAKKEKVEKVFIHCFMDGRDTPPMDGIKYIRKLQAKIQKKGIGQIASICGRYYAMDRDKRWDRIEKAYDVLTGATTEGKNSAEEIVKNSYDSGVGDEFILPKSTLIKSPQPPFVKGGGSVEGGIRDGDAVIFFNFRADRAREITRALTEADFAEFKRKKIPKLSNFVCMAPYGASFKLPVAFTPVYPKRIFAELVSEKGLTQLKLAETEKYAHVTYFFNGGQEKVFPGEERVLIPSPRLVATYDLKPEMSAEEIAEEALKRIESDNHDVIVLNFANSDMVGHTAKPAAIRHAVSVVDKCLGKVVDSVVQKGGIAVITSDHGNAEQMVDENGEPHTAHTLNPVPFILVSDKHKKVTLKKSGSLCDIAPTLLKILGIPQPKEMTGESLF